MNVFFFIEQNTIITSSTINVIPNMSFSASNFPRFLAVGHLCLDLSEVGVLKVVAVSDVSLRRDSPPFFSAADLLQEQVSFLQDAPYLAFFKSVFSLVMSCILFYHPQYFLRTETIHSESFCLLTGERVLCTSIGITHA